MLLEVNTAMGPASLPGWGVESGAGFPKEGVGEIQEHGLLSQWCVLGKNTFHWCTCRHWFSLLVSVRPLPGTGCGRRK